MANPKKQNKNAGKVQPTPVVPTTPVSEVIKNKFDKDGKVHNGCNFGRTTFNQILRDRAFIEESRSTTGTPGKGGGKPPKDPVGSTTTLATPTGLSASAPSGFQVNLTWNTVTNATFYNIFRNGSFLQTITTNTFSDFSVVPGTTYYYRVSAGADGYTTSAQSAQVAVSTAAGPQQPGVLLLDFNGHTVTNTAWNWSGPIVCNWAGLTPDEEARILANTREDFAQFNVIVTTDEAVYLAADPYKRARCVITETNEWYGNNAGGVAYLNSYMNGGEEPCFVFSKLLGYNTKYIMEAVSHELGHTLGLRHQAQYDANCNLLSAYYYGCCGSAPIMGVGYYQPDVKWWVGPTTSCNTIQDDVAILTSVLGLK